MSSLPPPPTSGLGAPRPPPPPGGGRSGNATVLVVVGVVAVVGLLLAVGLVVFALSGDDDDLPIDEAGSEPAVGIQPDADTRTDDGDSTRDSDSDTDIDIDEPGDSALGADPPDPEASPTPSDGADVGATISSFDLEPGDCFDEPEADYTRIRLLDCGEPHDNEVFAVFELGFGRADPYPGTDRVDGLASEGCEGSRFADYVGVAYADSELVVGTITPSEDTWIDTGDREVVCTLSGPELEPLDQSAAATNDKW